VWKLRKFILIHFWEKFRESNGFTKEITRVDLTKYFIGESKFFFFPHCAILFHTFFAKNFVKVKKEVRELNSHSVLTEIYCRTILAKTS